METDFLHIANREGLRDGTTAVVALVEESTLTIAHVGDSRGVLCRGGNTVAMTQATTSLILTQTPAPALTPPSPLTPHPYRKPD